MTLPQSYRHVRQVKAGERCPSVRAFFCSQGPWASRRPLTRAEGLPRGQRLREDEDTPRQKGIQPQIAAERTEDYPVVQRNHCRPDRLFVAFPAGRVAALSGFCLGHAENYRVFISVITRVVHEVRPQKKVD